MGILTRQRPVKLITSIIFKEEQFLEYAEERLEKKFGPIEPYQKVMPFEYTDYYYEEFGRPLKRKLICFKKLVNKEQFYRIKLATNNIEDRARERGNRTVNIDPGYIAEAKLVLWTTKDYTHRIYIGKSIFAESTLFFEDGTFKSWPWTYPDYASPELTDYFKWVREIYMKDIKGKFII
ncbi:MAG: DUF4416 family protein [Candidatus Omnitrophota bacterium]|nr:DUF4416 family protein [Candidatus Omnitrophota bacterium]